MESLNKVFILNNFDIRIKRIDEGLLIEADNHPANISYRTTLNKESVKSISKDQFFDLDLIETALIDYFEKKPEKVTVEFDEKGKLTYTCEMLFGNISKIYRLDIQLERQETGDIDAMTKIERQVGKLLMRFTEFEEKVTNKIDNIETRLARIEGGDGKSAMRSNFEFSFDKAGKFSEQFNVTNECKTATSKTKGYSSIFGAFPLPPEKKVRFTFRVIFEDSIMVGVAPRSALENNLCFKDPLSIGYNYDGRVFFNGSSMTPNLQKLGRGDEITVTFHHSIGEVSFEVNSRLCYAHAMERSVPSDVVFYPFLYTQSHIGAGVTLV